MTANRRTIYTLVTTNIDNKLTQKLVRPEIWLSLTGSILMTNLLIFDETVSKKSLLYSSLLSTVDTQ